MSAMPRKLAFRRSASRPDREPKITRCAISLEGAERRYIASRMTEHDPTDIQIGARVTARRKELRMTLATLARAVGVTFQQIQKYEKGTNRISASRLVAIAQVLETSAASLLAEDSPDMVAGASVLAKEWSQIPDPEQRQAIMTIVRSLKAA